MRNRKCVSKGIKIEFHRTYLIMALGFVLTGFYLNLIIFTSLILAHEFGHYFMAKINKFNVTKIVIYPYGGITKINDIINRDICEELLIANFGIIMQYLFYLIIIFCYRNSFIREYTFQLYTYYNNQMIFFNLLPIYPLDGSKILNLILYKFFPYYTTNMLIILISILVISVIVGVSIYSYNYSNLMVMMLLLTYLYDFFRKRKYLYQRFLLERYLYDINFSKLKIISSVKSMYKNRIHLFYKNNKYFREKEVISNLFFKE